MIKISGLDTLTRQLDEAQQAIDSVGEELGVINFDPTDPASIEAAIQDAERVVDERLGPYLDNAVIAPVAQQMKDAFREAVIAKAAEARLQPNT